MFMVGPEPPRRGRTGTQWRFETGWAAGGWSRDLGRQSQQCKRSAYGSTVCQMDNGRSKLEDTPAFRPCDTPAFRPCKRVEPSVAE